MIKEEIKKIIENVINGLDLKTHDRVNLGQVVLVEVPKEKTHGDYSTNVALSLAKKLGKNPMEVAREIAKELSSKALKNIGIETVEAVAPGFINFYLSKEFFVGELKKIDKSFGKNAMLKNKKVIVEYTDPNILKDFHIGHLMSNSIGEAIGRILEFSGAKVKRACYQSDVGMGIAKAVYGKMKNSLYPWQDSYVFGSKAYEENEQAKKEIVELNKKIFERTDKKVNALYDEGKKWSLRYFDGMYKKLGTKFDYFFLESEVADFGKKVVLGGLQKGIFEIGEKGAVIFKGEKFGLHTRVFVNSEGLPTYEAKELALAEIKYGKYKYDKSVIITGNDINEYFKVLLCVMKEVFPELESKTIHIGHGNMRLPEGKMSSRSGTAITAEFLIEKVKKLVLEKTKDRKLDASVDEQIAIGAIKYSILKQSISSDIVYDFEKSISFEGDSGPYLQYSYARAKSVLAKAKTEKVKASFKKVPVEISALEKTMCQFPEIVQKAGAEYEPHFVVLYLTELAREFNNYYAHNKIVDKVDEFSPYKVALTEAFSIIMKNGLWLLGIEALEKM